MAIYYKLSLTQEESIFQNDKSKDKKFFSNAKIKALIEQDAASATASAYSLLTYPLNSEFATIKNIIIHKKPTVISSTGIYFNNAENLGIPTPYHKLKILIGISNQDSNTFAVDLRSYQAQNIISIPCILSNDQSYLNLSNINEKFGIVNNKTFLNIFIYFYVTESGDVTTFYTDVNNIYSGKGGVLTLEDYLFDISVFISGRAV